MDISLGEIPHISKKELQKLLIVGTHLHQWQGQTKRDIPTVFQKQGFFQLDPLNPSGRSHDLFFGSRIKSYHRGEAEAILYPQKFGFESYFHNLDLISREFFPLFYATKNRNNLHQYYLSRLEKVEQKPHMIAQIKAYIADHGPTTSKDLHQFGSVATEQKKWTANSSGNILEVLWAMGELMIVKRDEQFHKYYDLIENHFSSNLLKNKIILPESELWQKRMNVMLHSFPVLDSKIMIGKNDILRKPRGKYAWLKRMDVPIQQLIEVPVKGSQSRFTPTLVYCAPIKKIFIVSANWREFTTQELDDTMRALSPLDPLIWDRIITQKVFGFEYLWEIYKPQKDRRWGYYHYPLLYQGKFIGRIEAKIPKKTSTLQFYNFYPEKGVKYTKPLKESFNKLVARWKLMVGASDLIFDHSCTKINTI